MCANFVLEKLSKFLHSEQAMDKKRGLEGVGEGLTPSDWACRSSHNQLFRTYWRKSRVYQYILNFTKRIFLHEVGRLILILLTELNLKVLNSHLDKLQLVSRPTSSIMEVLSSNIYFQWYFIFDKIFSWFLRILMKFTSNTNIFSIIKSSQKLYLIPQICK